MSDGEPMQGGCACGAVRYVLRHTNGVLPYACHCRDCQTRSGSAFMLNMFFAMECLAIEGALIGADVPKPNGSSAKQLACPRCLTRIYAVNSSNPTMGNLRAGTLDNSDQLVPAVHLWTSRKQPWLQLPENVPSFEKQPDDMMEWLRYLRPATSS